MFAAGTLAVATVRNQVVVVQISQAHSKRDKQIDVFVYSPFGEGVFIASDVPSARIPSSSIMSVLPVVSECPHDKEMVQLSSTAYSQYLECTSKHRKRAESLWSNWVSKN